jgi:hypothetical protein
LIKITRRANGAGLSNRLYGGTVGSSRVSSLLSSVARRKVGQVGFLDWVIALTMARMQKPGADGDDARSPTQRAQDVDGVPRLIVRTWNVSTQNCV